MAAYTALRELNTCGKPYGSFCTYNNADSPPIWHRIYAPTLICNKMRKDAIHIFRAGLQAVDPVAAVRRYVSLDHGHLIIGDKTFDLSHVNDLFVVGAGKASGAMAAALEEILADRITGGLVVVKYGHAVDLSRISLVEAGHPVPDKNGQEGAERIRQTHCKGR